MLTDLVVEDLGVIERAELQLEPGCSALTGETGAGKTLVVAALGLLGGGRADRSLVRGGTRAASVEGRFVVPADHPVIAVLARNGLIETAPGDLEIVVARTIASDGRASKARINGRLVPVSLLEEVGAQLIEIAGQNEQGTLFHPEMQRALLDGFAGRDVIDLAARVAEAQRSAAAAARDLAELEATERDRARSIDALRHEVTEISAAALEPGEAERLGIEARRLEHAETIASGLAEARIALSGEGGAAETLSAARRALEGGAEHDETLDPLVRRAEEAAIEVTDIAQEIAAREIPSDPDALDRVRDRLATIGRLTRKFGRDVDEVLAYLEEARTRLDELEEATLNADALAAEAERANKEALLVAGELSTRRREAAARLGEAVAEGLSELGLGDARFEVTLEERDLYEGGLETVSFHASFNSGEEPRPLKKVASGGELSRTALVLHLLTTAGVARTMVFDEVDAGVGGRAAQAVGRRLAQLARETGAQVLVVTHLPQVAAFADVHHRVDKTDDAGRAAATVVPIAGEERVAELSRMLAGLPESERAREHAQELLDLAAVR